MQEEDRIKVIYPEILQAIHWYRDWPTKVLAFMTAFFLGTIGGIIALNRIAEFKLANVWVKIVLVIFFLILVIWSIFSFFRCNTRYIEQRKLQLELRKKMNIEEWKSFWPYTEKTLPNKWSSFWGWGFNSIYVVVLFFIALYVILEII